MLSFGNNGSKSSSFFHLEIQRNTQKLVTEDMVTAARKRLAEIEAQAKVDAPKLAALSDEERATNARRPDFWGKSRCSIDVCTMIDRVGVDPNTRVGDLRSVFAGAGVSSYGLTVKADGWYGTFETGREYVSISGNSFVDDKGQVIGLDKAA